MSTDRACTQMSDSYGDDGDEFGDGFNALTKLYKRNPSLELYLKLRRENPEEEIEVGVLGGLDPLFARTAQGPGNPTEF